MSIFENTGELEQLYSTVWKTFSIWLNQSVGYVTYLSTLSHNICFCTCRNLTDGRIVKNLLQLYKRMRVIPVSSMTNTTPIASASVSFMETYWPITVRKKEVIKYVLWGPHKYYLCF